MSGRYFKLRLALVLVYVAVVGATAAWVAAGWPVDTDDQLEAEVSSVPGALRGRTLVLVVNRSERDWHDVELVLNEQLVHRVERIPAGEQHSVPIDAFTYIYVVPHDWNRGVWRGVSAEPQRQARERRDIEPRTLSIHAQEGRHDATLGSER